LVDNYVSLRFCSLGRGTHLLGLLVLCIDYGHSLEVISILYETHWLM